MPCNARTCLAMSLLLVRLDLPDSGLSPVHLVDMISKMVSALEGFLPFVFAAGLWARMLSRHAAMLASVVPSENSPRLVFENALRLNTVIPPIDSKMKFFMLSALCPWIIDGEDTATIRESALELPLLSVDERVSAKMRTVHAIAACCRFPATNLRIKASGNSKYIHANSRHRSRLTMNASEIGACSERWFKVLLSGDKTMKAQKGGLSPKGVEEGRAWQTFFQIILSFDRPMVLLQPRLIINI